MRGRRSRNPSSKKLGAVASESIKTCDKSEGKKDIFGDQIQELQVCLTRLSSANDEGSKDRALATQKETIP